MKKPVEPLQEDLQQLTSLYDGLMCGETPIDVVLKDDSLNEVCERLQAEKKNLWENLEQINCGFSIWKWLTLYGGF